jgi:RimJ/RimL family protein N-acetyltransferase
MSPDDVAAVLDLQEPSSAVGLANVFPQDEYPFPRDQVRQRWLRELDDPDVACHVVLLGSAVVGFAATRLDELLHFGIALEHWGSGLASQAHDAVLGELARRGVRRAWCWVHTDNHRARRFYEKHGWQPTETRMPSPFAPYPEMTRYERPIT